MTTSLAAVFIPILFMSGILGRLFREFAVTITAAILISGVVSITLTPMLCSRFLRVVHTQEGASRACMDRAFDALLRRLRVEPRPRAAPPPRDAGRLRRRARRRRCRCSASSRRGSSPIRTTTRCSSTCRRRRARRSTRWRSAAQRVADIVEQNPYVDSVHGQHRRRRRRVGGGTNNGAHPGAARAARAAAGVGAADRAAAAAAAAAVSRTSARSSNLPPSLQIGGRMGNSNYSLTVQSLNTDELYAWAPRLERGDRSAGAGDPGRLERPGDEEPARSTWSSTATRRRPSG